MKQQNITRQSLLMSRHVVGISLLGVLLLSGCSDSGLDPIRDEALNDAFLAQQAAPAIDLAENGGEPDPLGPDPLDLGEANGEDENPTTTPEAPSETPDETPDEVPDESLAETPAATPEGIDLTQFDLVFSDEFQGATLDPRKWNSALPWGPDVVIFAFFMDSKF